MPRKTTKKSSKKLKSNKRVISTRMGLFIILFAALGAYLLIKSFASDLKIFFSDKLDTGYSVSSSVVKDTLSTNKKDAQVVAIVNDATHTNAMAIIGDQGTQFSAGVYKLCMNARAWNKNISGVLTATTYSSNGAGTELGSNAFSVSQNSNYSGSNCVEFTNETSGTALAAVIKNTTQSGILFVANVSFDKIGDTPPPPPTSDCLSRSTIVRVSSPESGQYRPNLSDNSTVNATGANWTSNANGSYPILYDESAGNNVCMVGGKITGNWNEDTESWDTYHGAYAISVRSPGYIFDGVRIHNYGDGIGFGKGNSADWTIRNTWISHSHDDCVENDYMHSGLIEDSLLESCFSIVSARGHSGQTTKPDGRGETWTIKNSLLGIYAIKPVYNPSKYESPGHGGLFKWSEPKGSEGYGTKIALDNVIINLDGRKPNHQDYNIPYYGSGTSYLTSCNNVTVVWGGELRNGVPYFTEGSAAGTSAASQFSRWPSGCLKFTTDHNVWNNAVANWKAAHPSVN